MRSAVRGRLSLSVICPQLAAALARHLNNALIHLGNEAAHESRAHRHHAELLPYAPFMRWLKDMDEKAFEALAKVGAAAAPRRARAGAASRVCVAGVRGHVGARVRARGACGVRAGAQLAGRRAAGPRRRAARHREYYRHQHYTTTVRSILPLLNTSPSVGRC